ncbi:hypothetical protein IAT40_004142 [Kwoniella sp. CBS 6097]
MNGLDHLLIAVFARERWASDTRVQEIVTRGSRSLTRTPRPVHVRSYQATACPQTGDSSAHASNKADPDQNSGTNVPATNVAQTDAASGMSSQPGTSMSASCVGPASTRGGGGSGPMI